MTWDTMMLGLMVQLRFSLQILMTLLIMVFYLVKVMSPIQFVDQVEAGLITGRYQDTFGFGKIQYLHQRIQIWVYH